MSEEDLQLSIARLLAAGRAQARGDELQAALRHVLALGRELTSARFATLALVDQVTNEISLLLTLAPDGYREGSLGGVVEPGTLPLEEALLRLVTLQRLRGGAAKLALGSAGRRAIVSPVMVAGEIGGLLCLLDRASGDQFTESDGRTLDILAAWTALAIDRAKLGSDVERRRQDSELAARHLFGARDVASAVGRRTNRRKLFGEIAARTLELARARATLLWLLDDRHLVLQAIAGLSTDRMPGQRIPVSGHASIVLSGGRPLHSTVDRGGELIRGKATRRLGDGEASLLVPIRISTAPIGILVAAGSGDRALFSTSEERRVERLAAGAAAALVLSGAVSYEGVGAVPTDGVGASQSSGLELADGLDVLAGPQDAPGIGAAGPVAHVNREERSRRVERSSLISQLGALPVIRDRPGSIEARLHALAAAALERALELAVATVGMPVRGTASSTDETCH